jgi:hypothetical protein
LKDDDTIIVDTPQRLRALADPLRQRLLAAFSPHPMTVKAVAGQLGEPVTKLYRHIGLLVDAGFLRVVAEQRRRGAIERTFVSAAQRRYGVEPVSGIGATQDALARHAGRRAEGTDLLGGGHGSAAPNAHSSPNDAGSAPSV